MRKLILSSAILLGSLAFTGMSYACDMHGASNYGNLGMRGVNWQPYNPRVSTIDPVFLGNKFSTSVDLEALPKEKAKPSFSNAASLAASKAKARFVQKNDTKKTNAKTVKAPVKKPL